MTISSDTNGMKFDVNRKPIHIDTDDASDVFIDAVEYIHKAHFKLFPIKDQRDGYCPIRFVDDEEGNEDKDCIPFSAFVTISHAAQQVVREMQQIVHERMYFQAVVFSDEVHLYAKYNAIIGSRKLAEVTRKSFEELFA